MKQVISVSGSAVASVEPDRVSVRFGVETREKSSRAALAANAELMQSAIDALRDTGVSEDEISTSRFSIQAVYEYHQDKPSGNRRQVLVGYQVSNILTVETADLNIVAEIIDGGVAAGVNRVDSVHFSLSPEVMSELQDSLIESAVLDAREKAEKALAPLEQVIVGVKSVSLNQHQSSPVMLGDAPRMEMAMARSAPTQVFASDQDVRTDVQVVFIFKDMNTATTQDQ